MTRRELLRLYADSLTREFSGKTMEDAFGALLGMESGEDLRAVLLDAQKVAACRANAGPADEALFHALLTGVELGVAAERSRRAS